MFFFNLKWICRLLNLTITVHSDLILPKKYIYKKDQVRFDTGHAHVSNEGNQAKQKPLPGDIL